MNIKHILIILSCVWSVQCAAQIERLDTLGLYFTFQGNILDTFELEKGKIEINDVIMALNVQGNYLECVLENHTDSTYILRQNCGTLKTFVDFREQKKSVSPWCDYDNNNRYALRPNSGLKIYIPKSPIWKDLELRTGIRINDQIVYSNWVRYE